MGRAYGLLARPSPLRRDGRTPAGRAAPAAPPERGARAPGLFPAAAELTVVGERPATERVRNRPGRTRHIQQRSAALDSAA
ncbi:hypothetical protein GCM10027440_33460 [Nocardiopsis coralliicola]